MPQESITQKLKGGVTIGFYTKLATQASTFVFGLILARLLSPVEYGIVGVLTVFIVLISHFQDFGFSVALHQQKKVEIIDYNTVFAINFLLSIVLYFVFYFSAPIIADFYEDQRLVSVVKVLGLVNIIQAFGTTQGAYLNKCQHYLVQAKVGYISIVIASITAVVFAFLGFGYWALVIKTIALTATRSVGWWIISPWKPKIKVSYVSAKKLFSFGSKLFANSIIESVSKNIYSLLIGKLYSLESLGLYNRAKNFNDLPDQTFRQSLFSMIYPALSYYQDNDEKLLSSYSKLLKLLAYVLYPIYIMLFIIAVPMIEVLITDKWIEAAPLLKIFCFMAIFFPFESVNSNLLYVKGKSSFVVTITFIRRVLFFGLIFIAYRFGIEGLIWLLVLDSFVFTALSYYFAQKVFDFNLFAQMRSVKKIVLSLIPYTLLMFFVSLLFDTSLYKLIFVILTGGISYLILSYFFMRNELFEVLKILKIDKPFSKYLKA
jgi:teichuronic acid exporter